MRQTAKSEEELKLKMQTLQTQVMQLTASNTQQHDATAAQMRQMRDQSAELLQERQAARNLASTIEGQRQVAIRNAEQLHRNDREQLRQFESKAERAYTATVHKLTAAICESELDREMLVMTR